MTPPAARAILRWGGRVLAVLGLLFVGLRLRTYWDEIDLTRLGWPVWLALGGLSMLYGAGGFMLGSAWWQLLRQFGGRNSRRWALQAYGLSQISKYLPGNVFHLAARQARGMTAGIPGWPLAKSAAWEIGLLILSGALFVFLVFPMLTPALSVLWSVVLFLAALSAAGLVLWRLVGAFPARALAWQAGFLLLSGVLFLAVLGLLHAGPPAGRFVVVVGAYVIAWLAGLLTPGSPAGLGVREMVLLLLLEDVVAEADLLQAVILARLVSVLGDVLFFLGALALRNRAAAGDVQAYSGSELR